MINAQSYISLWFFGLNLKHCHVCLYFPFQTDYADTGGRNIIYTFEMQTCKETAPKSTNLISVVSKEIYLTSFFILFRGFYL